MSSPLLVPFATVFQPASRPPRQDSFALVPDGSGNLHVPHWNGPGSGALATDWKSLGGDGSQVLPIWLPDGTKLFLYLVGDDARIWTNIYDPATNIWGGWTPPNPAGAFGDITVATS